jgi:hypothetical protein
MKKLESKVEKLTADNIRQNEEIINLKVDITQLNRENENLRNENSDHLESIKQLQRQINPNYGTNTSGINLGGIALATQQDEFNSIKPVNGVLQGTLSVNPVPLNSFGKNNHTYKELKFKPNEVLEVTNKMIEDKSKSNYIVILNLIKRPKILTK